MHMPEIIKLWINFHRPVLGLSSTGTCKLLRIHFKNLHLLENRSLQLHNACVFLTLACSCIMIGSCVRFSPYSFHILGLLWRTCSVSIRLPMILIVYYWSCQSPTLLSMVQYMSVLQLYYCSRSTLQKGI